jgi:hypothetical protein
MPRPRTGSPSAEPSAKRAKTTHVPPVTSSFQYDLLGKENALRLHVRYAESTPFKYVVVDKLFQDDLLVKVCLDSFGTFAAIDQVLQAKDECINELSFTEKETDIYKVCTCVLFRDVSSSVCRSTKLVIWLHSRTSMLNSWIFSHRSYV